MSTVTQQRAQNCHARGTLNEKNAPAGSAGAVLPNWSQGERCSALNFTHVLGIQSVERRAIAQHDAAGGRHRDRRDILKLSERARHGFNGEAEIVGDILT